MDHPVGDVAHLSDRLRAGRPHDDPGALGDLGGSARQRAPGSFDQDGLSIAYDTAVTAVTAVKLSGVDAAGEGLTYTREPG